MEISGSIFCVKGTRRNGTILPAKAGARCGSLWQTLRSAVFSHKFREPGGNKNCARKHHAHRSFITAAAKAKNHRKINEMCHWPLSVGGYLYINLPSSLVSVNNRLVAAVVTLVIVVAIFLVLREVICCYWKINRMVELLESIDATLRSRERTG
jgi:hypothetical protein